MSTRRQVELVRTRPRLLKVLQPFIRPSPFAGNKISFKKAKEDDKKTKSLNYEWIREDINRKKNVFFRALPE